MKKIVFRVPSRRILGMHSASHGLNAPTAQTPSSSVDIDIRKEA
jgi:hypothetical protein